MASGNEIAENREDESEILTDEDETSKKDVSEFDEHTGAKSVSLGSLEDEPENFMMGEVDVRRQMDDAASVVEDAIHGVQETVDADDPNGELASSFRATPGGIEEVIEKTDEALAHKASKREIKKSDELH
jgi:hypothetical protein